MRRRPAAPGHRPRAGVRFAAGFCACCGEGFVLDREAEPWARARTCSAPCAKRIANSGRDSTSCLHCASVEAYRLARDSDVQRIEVSAADEDARAITFREWLVWTSREQRDAQAIAG